MTNIYIFIIGAFFGWILGFYYQRRETIMACKEIEELEGEIEDYKDYMKDLEDKAILRADLNKFLKPEDFNRRRNYDN